MTRLTAARGAPPFEQSEHFLTFGPLNLGPREFTDAEGAAAWSAHGGRLMAEWSRSRSLPGSRPFGCWRYGIGEHPDTYEDRVVLLAERGELSEEEIASLAKKRRWRDINTGVEHDDPEAVELYERVCEALNGGAGARRAVTGRSQFGSVADDRSPRAVSAGRRSVRT